MKFNRNNPTEISEITGFDMGEKFDTEAEVREYFTISNMLNMNPDFADDYWTQDDLDAMAESVIENHWHMNKGCRFESAIKNR